MMGQLVLDLIIFAMLLAISAVLYLIICQVAELSKELKTQETLYEDVQDWINRTIAWMNNQARKTLRNTAEIKTLKNESVFKEETEDEEQTD